MKLDCPAFLAAYRQTPPAESVLLDVRNPDETGAGALPNATLIPVGELEARVREIPSGKKVFVYCKAGGRASRAADILAAAGHHDVVVAIEGGYEQLARG